jgi:hypothetical protein
MKKGAAFPQLLRYGVPKGSTPGYLPSALRAAASGVQFVLLQIVSPGILPSALWAAASGVQFMLLQIVSPGILPSALWAAASGVPICSGKSVELKFSSPWK